MRGRIYVPLIFAAFATSLALSPLVVGAQQADEAVKTEASAAIKPGQPKPDKPVKVKAPPKPAVKTVVAPGTWQVHRHRGNSPKFRPDREKDWVDPTGGAKPVKGTD